MSGRALQIVSFLLLLHACDDGGPRRVLVTVDTLPGGVPRTLSTAPSEPGEWHLEHERDVQPSAGAPGELVAPESIALADDGTLFLLDSKPASVRVYGPDGGFLRTVGGEGAGPGEFKTGFLALRGDTLVVHDPQQARSTVYLASTGAVLSVRPTTCCYWSPFGIDGTGHAWVRSIDAPDSTRGPGQLYVRFPIGASGADTVMVSWPASLAHPPQWNVADQSGNMRMSVQVPLTPQSIEAVDPTAGLVTGFGGEYLLRRSSNGRDTTALFGRTAPSLPVPTAEKDALAAERMAQIQKGNPQLDEITLRKAFDPELIPDIRPAFDAVFVDRAGRTFVRRSEADTTAVHFDLFDQSGVWIDVLTLAEPNLARSVYLPTAFSSDRIAVATEDADGLPIIRIYHLMRKPQ